MKFTYLFAIQIILVILQFAGVKALVLPNTTNANQILEARQEAPFPQFYVPNANTPAGRARLLQLQQGYSDALTLAAVAMLYANECDEVFLRYFEADDADFVRGKHIP
jgi:hypothetical protein